MCPTGSSTHLFRVKKDSNFHSAFDVLDTDRDGKISREDLQAFYGGIPSNALGICSDEDVIGSMIHHADSNKDGYVEYNEFEKILMSRNLEEFIKHDDGRLSFMKDAFRLMDKDGDGKIGHEDLKDYLKCTGFDASDEDVKAMIKLGGGHQNGGVTFQGFLKILAV